MDSYERIKRTFAHQETDRVPILDSPWAGTIRRWQREGMPQGMDWRDYFDVDKSTTLHIDISPRYESKVIEETDEYIIHTTGWGTTLREFKVLDATISVGASIACPFTNKLDIFISVIARMHMIIQRFYLCKSFGGRAMLAPTMQGILKNSK